MEIVTTIAPIALALIMLALGLGLSLENFANVIKQPKDFLVGLICQLILLPIIAFILIKIFNTSPELAIGVMIIAAAPGGVTSNVLTKFANGDVALSVSLTAIISLVSIITVPFIVFKSADLLNINYQSAEISMVGISMKMFLVVTFPVFIGMLIRKFATNFISSKEQLIQRISVFLFALVFLAILIEEEANIIPYLAEAGLITLVLNLTMMILGFYIAKKFASGIAQRKCISLECGLQNGTLAIFVSTQIFDNSTYLVPTATYALIMFITSIIFVFIVKKSS
ncbi:bile acid:sodium symporter family protein [Candidatus Pelagibacter bacterium]|jgi:BASS family bile acid:Na+ symporter|nr:bile acid:sodium symporter family protein [Candidatus Pelagibacter bacterium]MDA8833253.1 bile acid:sodium symporter family protein [Candidatus Pelagibacter bacterium]MDA8932783.1 bile acid:sodium symporter family protein [Candidatus Pelagibacter ubique]MDC1344732.1 bile acid:sodium symporter family protein [Candidatus Pelagibacter ubique]